MKRNIGYIAFIIVMLLKQFGIDANVDQLGVSINTILQGVALIWQAIGVIQSLIKKWKSGEIDLFKIVIEIYKKMSEKK